VWVLLNEKWRGMVNSLRCKGHKFFLHQQVISMEKFNIVAKDKSVRPNAVVKQKVYKQNYNNHDLTNYLIMHYKGQKNLGHTLQTILLQTTVPRATFLRHWEKSGLKSMALQKKPLDQAKTVLCSYLANVKLNSKNTEAATNANKYLSPDEEMSFLQILRGLAACGKGVTKQEAMAMIDDIINVDVDSRHQVECSEKVLRRMMEKHPELVKIISAGSLDPARARKATRATRDAVFYKLNAFIQNLHSMGKVPWKNYKDVPCRSIYNMDEASTDTTKHRSKIIANAAAIIRKYTETPEGDDKMNMHITACLTTRADGKFEIKNRKSKIEKSRRRIVAEADCRVLIFPPRPHRRLP
jgi:hypothetical protein